MNIAYLNGKKCGEIDVISLYNPSFLYGVNCFEGIRLYWVESKGRPVFLDLGTHLDRLYRSMDLLSFDPPLTRNEMEQRILSIVESERVAEDAYIRVTVFIGEDGSWRTTKGMHWLVSIRSQPRAIGRPEAVRLGVSRFRRIATDSMPPQVKAGANYLNSRYAFLDARGRGFDDALFLTADGVVSEATGSAIFFVAGDTLVTPSLDCDLLQSITRGRVIAHCAELGLTVEEARIPPARVGTFDAAFLTGTSIELAPVASIDEHAYAADNPVFRTVLADLVARIDAGDL